MFPSDPAFTPSKCEPFRDSCGVVGQREDLATLASQSWKVVAGPRDGSRGLEQNADIKALLSSRKEDA